MKILHFFRLTILSVLLFGGNTLFAQPDPKLPAGENPGVNTSWLPSKTPDGAIDRRPHLSQPIPWQYIRQEDVLWSKRVWREIDTREKQNVGFRYTGDEYSGGGMFIEILIDAINRGKIKAYSNFDDRFTSTISKDQLREQLIPKPDTLIIIDPTTGQEIQKIINHDFDPATVTKYRIKEDWIFDRNQGQMVVRIVGIAPVKDIVVDGDYRGSQALFWLYYPDIRGLLANYEVFNPQNDVARYTWDEFFESRQFSSKITKVSNPFGTSAGSGGASFKDENLSPMESLYESKRTAEEIFNKEHDMWVY